MAFLEVLGGFVKLGAAIEAGKAEEQTANAAANVAGMQAYELDRKADETRDQYREESRRARVMARRDIGSQVASYAASGVTQEGSAMDVLQESVSNAEMDYHMIRQQGEAIAGGLNRQAFVERNKADAVRAAGSTAAAAAILGTGSGAATNIAQAYTSLNYKRVN